MFPSGYFLTLLHPPANCQEKTGVNCNVDIIFRWTVDNMRGKLTGRTTKLSKEKSKFPETFLYRFKKDSNCNLVNKNKAP